MEVSSWPLSLRDYRRKVCSGYLMFSKDSQYRYSSLLLVVRNTTEVMIIFPKKVHGTTVRLCIADNISHLAVCICFDGTSKQNCGRDVVSTHHMLLLTV